MWRKIFLFFEKSGIPVVVCVAKCIKLGLNAVYRFQGVKMFEQIVTNKVHHIIESSNLTYFLRPAAYFLKHRDEFDNHFQFKVNLSN